MRLEHAMPCLAMPLAWHGKAWQGEADAGKIKWGEVVNQLRWSSAHLLPSPPFGGGKWGLPSPPARKNRVIYLPPGRTWMELVPFSVSPPGLRPVALCLTSALG